MEWCSAPRTSPRDSHCIRHLRYRRCRRLPPNPPRAAKPPEATLSFAIMQSISRSSIAAAVPNVAMNAVASAGVNSGAAAIAAAAPLSSAAATA